MARSQLWALLNRLWLHLSRRRRRQFGLLLCLTIVSALTEVASLGAVVPFLGVLTDPERVLSIPIIATTAYTFGLVSADQLALPITLGFAAVAMIAGAVRLVLLWASTRLAYASGADLSIEVYRRTLYQPYSVHVNRNSSEVISGITTKVDSVVLGVVLSALTFASSSILLVATTILLIAIDPVVALLAAAGFGVGYALITGMVRQRLVRNGQRISCERTQVIKALQEGLGGIRDVLLDGTQPIYCKIYSDADCPLRRAQGNNNFMTQSPRYVMEALGLVLIALLAYALSMQGGGVASALPVLGALALGAQRLLPALQQIYSAWANIIGNKASLVDTLELLDQPLQKNELPVLERLSHTIRKNICFDAVHFRHTDDGPWILENLNLIIPKGTRTGIVGGTGSGKSTMLDILMGLLTPDKGRILVDGQPIVPENIRAWQRMIAHVPQSIYLADATLAENIAFGVPLNLIDMSRVHQVARQAQIAEFIETRPEGYRAYVGERGIRLSGGQRQRIGIARALYKQATVLVFDEATSALDHITEQSVMGAIEQLSRDLTILLIAHRLTTVRHCDTIIELESGRIVAQGTYEQLIERSMTFRQMASIDH